MEDIPPAEAEVPSTCRGEYYVRTTWAPTFAREGGQGLLPVAMPAAAVLLHQAWKQEVFLGGLYPQ